MSTFPLLSFIFLIYLIVVYSDQEFSISAQKSENNNQHQLSSPAKGRSRLRRREFVQEEVRKTMFQYMTSLKGEITDVVLEEMINYYNGQTSKLYRLEKELVNLKQNSSMKPDQQQFLEKFKTEIIQLSRQQRSFATNISSIERKVTNITEILNDITQRLIEIDHGASSTHDSNKTTTNIDQQAKDEQQQQQQQQQQQTNSHVRRLVSSPIVKKDLEEVETPTDCDDLLKQRPSTYQGGIFRIKPRNYGEPFDVHCVFENNTAWTIIQRRVNGSVDFYRGWKDYKTGFGDLRGEHWLGLSKIHALTSQGRYMLRIDLLPWDATVRYAEYGKFSVGNETNKYKLSALQYRASSTAGDSISAPWDTANGSPFSTFDNDNDKLFYDNCALTYHGAWWFTSCFQSHLNGQYIRSPLALYNTARNGIHWNTYGLYHSMRETTMRIRRSQPYRSYERKYVESD